MGFLGTETHQKNTGKRRHAIVSETPLLQAVVSNIVRYLVMIQSSNVREKQQAESRIIHLGTNLGTNAPRSC